jgi:hypothetical protein
MPDAFDLSDLSKTLTQDKKYYLVTTTYKRSLANFSDSATAEKTLKTYNKTNEPHIFIKKYYEDGRPYYSIHENFIRYLDHWVHETKEGAEKWAKTYILNYAYDYVIYEIDSLPHGARIYDLD